jgi:hypothetical protein
LYHHLFFLFVRAVTVFPLQLQQQQNNSNNKINSITLYWHFDIITIDQTITSMTTLSKSQSLFCRVFPTRGNRNNDAPSDSENSTFESFGGVFQEPTKLLGTKNMVLMIVQEEEEDDGHFPSDHPFPSDLGKKLMSLNDNATATTGTISTASSFDESMKSSSLSGSRSFTSTPMNLEWRRQPSQRNLFANMDMHNNTLDEEEEEEEPQEDCNSDNSNTVVAWKSSGDTHHHDGAPLITLRSESVRLIDLKRPELQLDDNEVLHKVLTSAAKRLPRHLGNFASLHIMINRERLKHQAAPLQLAREHAAEMACKQYLHHAKLTDLQESLMRRHTSSNVIQRIGSNVASCGDGNLARLFSCMMKENTADRNNILDRRYTCMGVGTAKSTDGKLYVCQLFT